MKKIVHMEGFFAPLERAALEVSQYLTSNQTTKPWLQRPCGSDTQNGAEIKTHPHICSRTEQIFLNEEIQMTYNHAKVYSTTSDIITPQLQWLIRITNDNGLFEDVGKGNSSIILIVLWTGTTTMESNMEFSQKTKDCIMIWISYTALGHRTEGFCARL